MKMKNDRMIFTEGRVLLRFIVTKDGGVRDPEVIEAEPEGIFEASAIEALKNYIFAPATKNGEPVDCIAKLPMTFNVAGQITKQTMLMKQLKKAIISLRSRNMTMLLRHSLKQ
jgi:TonB family protein